jgi:hypothetical protein
MREIESNAKKRRRKARLNMTLKWCQIKCIEKALYSVNICIEFEKEC